MLQGTEFSFSPNLPSSWASLLTAEDRAVSVLHLLLAAALLLATALGLACFSVPRNSGAARWGMVHRIMEYLGVMPPH